MKKNVLIVISFLSVLAGCVGCNPRNAEAVEPKQSMREEPESAALSPDGTLKAFVRGTPDVLVKTAMDKEEATEIWTSRADGRDPKLRLRGHSGAAPENTLASFGDLQFSPDGRRLFFLSAAWVTSRAVHVLDLDSDTEKYVCPGNSLEVIQRGRYAGCLMVSQHRYLLGGGSYDWLWLITPEGKDIGPIAKEDDAVSTQMFRELYIKQDHPEPKRSADTNKALCR